MRTFSRRSVKMPTLPTGVVPSWISAAESDTGTRLSVDVERSVRRPSTRPPPARMSAHDVARDALGVPEAHVATQELGRRDAVDALRRRVGEEMRPFEGPR
jgi:hypothetical protein